ncbi:MAG: DUF805 domain-containing protein [Hyphomicrobiales bacterium]
MDWAYLFTSFDGRINRKPYWIAILLMVAFILIFTFVLTILTAASARAQLWVQIGLLIVVGYPITALMIKRLHDRNRPGNLAAVIWAPSIVSILGQLIGLTGSYQPVGGQEVFLPNTLGWIVLAASLVIGIWALIELGFLRGTDGANDYGPDPLQ